MKLVLLLSLFALSTLALDLQHLINDVNSKSSSWVAGHNQYFADMKRSEVRRILGWNGKGVPLPDVSSFPEVTGLGYSFFISC